MDDRTTPAKPAAKPSRTQEGRHARRRHASRRAAPTRATRRSRAEPDNWTSVPADERGDAIVAAMGLGGVDYMFFNSGSEIMFMQEAIAKANALGRPAPKLVMMTHEYPTLNAALGYAAVSGRMAATAVHVDVGTQHYGCAIHTARHSGLPVLITAGAPPVSFPGSMRGARDGSHFWVQQTPDQNGIVRQYMKWDHRLEYQDNAGLIVSRALQIAQSEPRGPVYLSLPREIAFLPTEGARFPTAQQLGIARAPAPDPDGVRELAERLVKARNPAIVVQRSGRNPATVPALVRLAEFLGVPVGEAAARSYQCFPMDHPLYQSITLDLAKADVVLVIEADVPWIPGPQQPPRDAYVAVVDIDPIKAHIGTYEFGADMRLIARHRDHARPVAARRCRSSPSAGDRARFEERAARWADVSLARLRESERAAQAHSKKSPISPLWLSYQIGQAMDDNCLMLDETLMLSPLPPYLRFSRARHLLPQSRQRRRLVRRRRARRQARPARQGRGRGQRRRLLHVFRRQCGDRVGGALPRAVHVGDLSEPQLQHRHARDRAVLSRRLFGARRPRGRLLRSADRLRQGGRSGRRLWREREGPGASRSGARSAASRRSAAARRP